MCIQKLHNKIKYLFLYIRKRKRFPNPFRPKDYSEFIFWDILLNRNDKRFFLADKYAVRKFVVQKGLYHILPKLFGVWHRAEEINFDLLPDKFVLKCNHSCNMNIICTNKFTLNLEESINTLNTWLNTKHPIFYETHYNFIEPLVFCEEYITDNKGVFPIDYKIHCALGKPVLIQACYERNENSPGKRILYDTNWRDLNYVTKTDSHFACETVDRPKNLDLMLEYATILSDGLKYARIDLYDTGQRVVFSEITLTPMGGWLSYFTQDALIYVGNRIRNRQS